MTGRERNDRTFEGFQQRRIRLDLCSSVKRVLKNGDGRENREESIEITLVKDVKGLGVLGE